MGTKAIIIGAGPAGLTAAYELLKRTDITPVILEQSGAIGGISKTINYKGNRMDIGGHRFFSKSDRVMKWWLNIMPLPGEEEKIEITYHNQTTTINNSGGMLVRKRLSRIYFLRKFFSYPIQLSFDTLRKLGVITTTRILASYCYAQLFPNKPEKSLEDFLINRFGKTLYRLFFKDYTEKVWGIPCSEIPADWGAQRIKGVSISKAIAHALSRKTNDVNQKNTETSLIEQFLYPALGPGQLWEEVARQVVTMGGEIIPQQQVKTIAANENTVTGVTAIDATTGEETLYEGDYFFSTMPVKELIAGMGDEVPADVKAIAEGLQYRDFIIVGVLLKKTAVDLKDTWIYIQERDVKVGRIQLFNNWSPYMVASPDTVWMGMEYFCNKGDAFWQLSDEAIMQTAIGELEQMGLAQVDQVLDTMVHREEKTYPAYFGAYEQFDLVKEHVNKYENLFLVGRNGMHKYNNSDHSMLTAMTAVDNVVAGVKSKENIWAINTEQEYHEEKVVVKKPKENTWAIGVAAVLILAQFIIFKVLYPFASFMPDSSGYIGSALDNTAINVWPIGYSKFLQFFTLFSRSDTALVLVQYLMLQGSALWFLFTLSRFVQIRPLVKYVLMAFIVLNPLLLITANYVSSDALFISLSFIWAAQLLSLIYDPRKSVLIAHVLILYLAFVVRYNSLYYPLISTVVILATSLRWKTKLTAIGVSFLLIMLFSWYTSNKYRSLTGEKQFAAFAGWQLAGNALYAYSHSGKKIENVPIQFKNVHRFVNRHIDSLNKLRSRPDNEMGTYYQWKGPLEEYYKHLFPKEKDLTNFQLYSVMAPLFEAYGKYLIREQPAAYARRFLVPNLVRYYVPPAEFLLQYNIYSRVPPRAQRLFRYKNVGIDNNQRVYPVMTFIPVLSAMINLLFLCSLIGFCWMGGLKKMKGLSPVLLLVTALWLANMVFSVMASPIVLRYQVFTMSMVFFVGVLLTEFIYNYDKENNPGSSKPLADPAIRLRSYEQAAGV